MIVLSIIYGLVLITLCIDIPFDVICAINISSVDEENWLNITFNVQIISHKIIWRSRYVTS